ncbi:peptidyl-prolyl cis-trans isomerase [Halalkalibaculum sp. DA3122]|uniref:peptidyl-prolyl cis-trans isomerase n=1 Tax=Halalkalibaculum sp. DA3122 TaxID=3373607 RepID=UPI003754630D
MLKVTNNYVFLLTILIPVLLAGCQQRVQTSSEGQLARVGNTVLTIDEAAERAPEFLLKEDSLSALHRYREDWIRRQVILQEAQRLGVNENREIRNRLERLREEVLVQGLKDYVMAEHEQDLEITDEEARNYYQQYKDQLVLDERYVRFRHVVTNTHQDAQSAKDDLMRGIEWPEVARTYSKNGEARIQESEKFWPISMALADNTVMNTLLQRIGITEISPIRRVNGDYHFIQLMETRPAGGHPDLDWLMDQIKEWLRIEKRRRHFNSYVKNLYLNAQSNNEIERYNVLESNINAETTEPDTLLSSESNE